MTDASASYLLIASNHIRSRKTQNERAEWRESLKQNIVQQQNKELLIQQERVDDFKRQEVYAEMLEKEHIARMGALESALSYQPPPSSIRAAEGITWWYWWSC